MTGTHDDPQVLAYRARGVPRILTADKCQGMAYLDARWAAQEGGTLNGGLRPDEGQASCELHTDQQPIPGHAPILVLSPNSTQEDRHTCPL